VENVMRIYLSLILNEALEEQNVKLTELVVMKSVTGSVW
jgi:hypothetical protein